MAKVKKSGKNEYYSTKDALEFIDNLSPFALPFYRRGMYLRANWGHIDKECVFMRVEMLIVKYNLTEVKI